VSIRAGTTNRSAGPQKMYQRDQDIEFVDSLKSGVHSLRFAQIGRLIRIRKEKKNLHTYI